MTTETETAAAAECSCCGEPLMPEEIEYPQTDTDGDGGNICNECYHEHYEFTCCRCCNYGHVDDQHEMLVVFEEQYAHGKLSIIMPGVYRITGSPYHGGPLIGRGYLNSDVLVRIADVNPDMDGNGYPCGHLCKECQDNVTAQFSGWCRVCLSQQNSCLYVRLGKWKDPPACTKYAWSRSKIVCANCRHEHRGAWERMGKR
jgi:hypothetical protein